MSAFVLLFKNRSDIFLSLTVTWLAEGHHRIRGAARYCIYKLIAALPFNIYVFSAFSLSMAVWSALSRCFFSVSFYVFVSLCVCLYVWGLCLVASLCLCPLRMSVCLWVSVWWLLGLCLCRVWERDEQRGMEKRKEMSSWFICDLCPSGVIYGRLDEPCK